MFSCFEADRVGLWNGKDLELFLGLFFLEFRICSDTSVSFCLIEICLSIEATRGEVHQDNSKHLKWRRSNWTGYMYK